jgi:hypothetical protein
MEHRLDLQISKHETSIHASKIAEFLDSLYQVARELLRDNM